MKRCQMQMYCAYPNASFPILRAFSHSRQPTTEPFWTVSDFARSVLVRNSVNESCKVTGAMLDPVRTSTSELDPSKNVEMAPLQISIVSALNPACKVSWVTPGVDGLWIENEACLCYDWRNCCGYNVVVTCGTSIVGCTPRTHPRIEYEPRFVHNYWIP